MTATTIDEYLAGYDGEVRDRLERVRAAIHSVLPDAEESIKYGMPAVTIRGRHHLYFAAWKKHIGFYPVYRSDDPIETEIAPYRDAKDTLQFPYTQEQPDDLIARVTAHLAGVGGAA
ncbi:iron chaperone [Pseudolysinimonas yzui]|uniref:YdhG-like domain-containing protein n=1 Tax=Pseudolysinimonas yzui TaxID=2708254 RepID=A0A8J3GQ63_9MICO|nr:DUF1801 domain-containing protein [Pseudolysinimonas yzui]GHF13819.1 hypothetical protein GCM10011600_13430 [Pseudolysinimonas yzui]